MSKKYVSLLKILACSLVCSAVLSFFMYPGGSGFSRDKVFMISLYVALLSGITWLVMRIVKKWREKSYYALSVFLSAVIFFITFGNNGFHKTKNPEDVAKRFAQKEFARNNREDLEIVDIQLDSCGSKYYNSDEYYYSLTAKSNSRSDSYNKIIGLNDNITEFQVRISGEWHHKASLLWSKNLTERKLSDTELEILAAGEFFEYAMPPFTVKLLFPESYLWERKAGYTDQKLEWLSDEMWTRYYEYLRNFVATRFIKTRYTNNLPDCTVYCQNTSGFVVVNPKLFVWFDNDLSSNHVYDLSNTFSSFKVKEGKEYSKTLYDVFTSHNSISWLPICKEVMDDDILNEYLLKAIQEDEFSKIALYAYPFSIAQMFKYDSFSEFLDYLDNDIKLLKEFLQTGSVQSGVFPDDESEYWNIRMNQSRSVSEEVSFLESLRDFAPYRYSLELAGFQKAK